MIAVIAAALLSRQVTLIGVGDIVLARWVGKRIEREGVDSPFRNVKQQLSSANLAVGNLECAVTDLPFGRRKPIQLRANPQVVQGLKSFSLLSLANNHSEDCGPEGLEDARERLKKAGIESVLPTGLPVFITKRGIRFAFVGLYDLPGYPLSTNWRQQMQTARSRSDDVIVIVHWGQEGSSNEDSRQRRLASQLAKAGADLILGSHPHVVQPVKTIAGYRGRKCIVAYSLGNFVFDAPIGPERQTAALQVNFTAKGISSKRVLHGVIDDGYPRDLK